MSNPLGTADFFALEAGECLDRLESLMSRPNGPPPDEFLRFARALRGSALMANQPAIARAAAGLEALARALRDGTAEWAPATRERAGQAIDEFRQLVRRTREWTSADAGRAARLTTDLEALSGAPIGALPGRSAKAAGAPGELNTGVRAFVAREGALIASALDRAARALQETPEAREPLYAVLRRMQSLRGLAEISELPPLPEILDGIELAVGDLTRLFAPPPGVGALLDAAARALTRIARDVAGAGRLEPDPQEARAFTELLLRAFATERDVVPIESLYVDGDASPLQRNESQPQFSAPAPLGPLELVSYGEHLMQFGDRIEEAVSATARDLRLYTLVGTLRSISAGGSDPVASAVAVFGRSARESIGTGAAAADPTAFAACLRDAGALLRSLAEASDVHVVGRRLLDAAHQLDIRRTETPQATAAQPAGATAIVSIESLAYGDALAIPVERPVVAIESLAPDDGPNQLETSYMSLARLIAAEAPVMPPVLAPAPLPAEVDIRSLCYSGRGALERAVVVRDSLASGLAGAQDFQALEPLLRELLDLVPLALEHAD